MISGRLLILALIVVLLLTAMAIIVIAALAQKPTRQWRIQWQENTADLRRSGIRTLKGEPVQARVVPFEELFYEPVPHVYSVATTQQTTYHFPPPPPPSVEEWESVDVVPEPGPFSQDLEPATPRVTRRVVKEFPKEPELSWDEKRELGLVGSSNPGPPDVSPVPEIPPGEFWIAITAVSKHAWELTKQTWEQVLSRYQSWNEQRGKALELDTEESADEAQLEEQTDAGESTPESLSSEPTKAASSDLGLTAAHFITLPIIDELAEEVTDEVAEEAVIEVAEEAELPPPPPPPVSEPGPPPPPAVLEVESPTVARDWLGSGILASIDEEPSIRIFDLEDEEPPVEQSPLEQSPPNLTNWIGGLRYLREPRPKDEWRRFIPRISEMDYYGWLPIQPDAADVQDDTDQ